MIDFTKCELNKYKAYGGRTRRKIGIIYDNETYMLKFPFRLKTHYLKPYSNDCFSEYISCHIAETIGLEVQKTLLGNFENKVVVACKDFEKYNFIFYSFFAVKNSVLESKTNGNDTRLNEILFSIENQHSIDKKKLKTFFWDMFIFDAYIGNTNRHNENWGLLLDNNRDISIAPIFACGSSLYPHILEEDFTRILNNKNEIKDLVFSNSALKNDSGTNINYYTFLTTTDNEDCLRALKKIYSKIDKKKVNDIIDSTPYITDNHKKFLKTVLKERQEKILLKALQRIDNDTNKI